MRHILLGLRILLFFFRAVNTLAHGSAYQPYGQIALILPIHVLLLTIFHYLSVVRCLLHVFLKQARVYLEKVLAKSPFMMPVNKSRFVENIRVI